MNMRAKETMKLTFKVLLLAAIILQVSCNASVQNDVTKTVKNDEDTATVFSYDKTALSGKMPWTNENFKNNPDNFQFAIIGDHTGGANVLHTFAMAMDQLNLLQPEFVINVGEIYRAESNTVAALNNVTLSIEKGEFVCVAGPSGSGKSTLLHIAGILDAPSEGEVIINGRQTRFFGRTDAALFRRQYIGFIFQRFNLIPILTAFENIEYILALLNVPAWKRKEKVERALYAVGLMDFMHQRAKNLSGGQ